MRQININPNSRIEIEPGTIKSSKFFDLLKPVVFEEDKLFCCVFGADMRFAVKGFGHTPEEAIEDWETSVKKRLNQPFENDMIVKYILGTLSGIPKSQAS